MSATDPGYASLLTYLHQPSSAVPAVQSSISHYLAHLSPSVTPLAATLVSSPLFFPYANTKLEVLATACRHAVHLKHQLLKANRYNLFQKGVRASLGDWTNDVVAGLKGGPAIMRLTISGGLLFGLEDIDSEAVLGDVGWRRRLQDEVIMAVAETMDLYVQTEDGWEKEFQPETEKGEGEYGTPPCLVVPDLMVIFS
jgi:hypothetical protein